MIGGDINLVASLNQFRANKKKKINPYLFAGGGIASVSVDAINGSDEVDVLETIDFDDDWDLTAYLTDHSDLKSNHLIPVDEFSQYLFPCNPTL